MSVNGEKSAMAAHLRKCPNSTKSDRRLADEVVPPSKHGRKRTHHSSDDNTDVEDNEASPVAVKKRLKVHKSVEKLMTQSKLRPFKGIDIPFTSEQKAAIQAQFLLATESANLPERWVEDPEVIKLFLMLRSAACDVTPSRRVLGTRLLDEASDRVERGITTAIKGAYGTSRYDFFI